VRIFGNRTATPEDWINVWRLFLFVVIGFCEQKGGSTKDLSDVKPDSGWDDSILLDAPDYFLILTYMDGIQQEKGDTDRLSLSLYRHFLS
jgi:hypothetical protein